ncbi:MAG: hypothetical protein AAB459_04475 [Patescibacteria group bacterium]
MTTVLASPFEGELEVAQSFVDHRLPENFEFFPDCQPNDVIQSVIDNYNRQAEKVGVRAIYDAQPEVKRAPNGLSYAVFGQPAEVLILMQNPFATSLEPDKLFRGQFLRASLEASGVVGSDGATPQVVQIASACMSANIPLSPSQHWRLANGDIAPVANLISELVARQLPQSQKVISVGYSMSAFLTPEIMKSLNSYRQVLAGFISNPPGVKPQPMWAILDNFAHAGEHMNEHLLSSGLKNLQPKGLTTFADKAKDKAKNIANVVWRPTNLSLWRAFSKGELLQRVQSIHRQMPEAIIDFAFGYEDPLCCPDVLEDFLAHDPSIHTSVVEHGDHAWGSNVSRSMGGLVLTQIKEALTTYSPNGRNHALAA